MLARGKSLMWLVGVACLDFLILMEIATASHSTVTSERTKVRICPFTMLYLIRTDNLTIKIAIQDTLAKKSNVAPPPLPENAELEYNNLPVY